MKHLTVDPFYLENNPSLFGVYFTRPPLKNKGFIICHPFGEEKKSAHRTLFEMARSLSNAGYPALMFDFYGCGDSDGSLADTDLDLWEANLADAIDELKAKTNVTSVVIIGLRFSATFSLVAAHARKDVAGFILLEPIVSFAHFLRKALRQKLIKELLTNGNVQSNRDQLLAGLQSRSIDFDGHEITLRFYESLMRWDRRCVSLSEPQLRLAILSLSSRGTVSREARNFRKLIAKNSDSEVLALKMDPFWLKIETIDCQVLYTTVLSLVSEKDWLNSEIPDHTTN